MALLTQWLVGLWLMVPLGAPSSPAPAVYPTQGNGFAAWIVGGFFGLGVLVLFMVWTSRRPRRPS